MSKQKKTDTKRVKISEKFIWAFYPLKREGYGHFSCMRKKVSGATNIIQTLAGKTGQGMHAV